MSSVPSRFVSRRVFLTIALGTAGAVVGACSPAAPAAPTAAPAAPTSPPASAPTSAPAAAPTTAAKPQAAPTTAAPAAAAPTAAPTQAGAQPKTGGTLRVALFRDQTSLDPIYGTMTLAERTVMEQIYEGLVSLDDKLQVIPALATSWDASSDTLQYTFHLRQGVKFSDGTPFNADAVKFNADNVLDPANNSPWAASWGPVTSVDVVDPNTVRFTFSKPYGPFLSFMGGDAGRLLVASPDAIKKYGKDLALHPVGTGPFVMDEWVRSDHITLKRNPDYWDKPRPYVDQVIIRPIVDDTVKLQNLTSGNVDFIDTVPFQEVSKLKGNSDFTVLNGPVGTRVRFTMHTQKEPFNNKALRQAVFYGVDRQALNDTVYFGLAGLTEAGIPPSSWAYDSSIPVQKQDLALAKQKLAEGGKPNGFTVPYLTANGPEQQQIAEVFKEQLAQIGINLDIQLVTDAQNRQAGAGHQFTASWSQWQGRSDPDPAMYPIYHSGDVGNYELYSNPDVDKWLEQARYSTDQNQRKQLYSQITKQIVEDVPEFVVSYPPYLTATAKKVQGVVIRPIPLPYFKTVWLQ